VLHLRLRAYFCRKAYNSPKNNKCAADNFISNPANALQNVTPPDPTNYNNINDNMSNNSDDDPMDLTDCIVYVKAIEDYTGVTKNDESINYDEVGIFYWN
jgi:hypothetical protein